MYTCITNHLVQTMQYKSRSGYKVTVVKESITLERLNRSVSFNKSDISEVYLKRSIYDLPFFESTIVVRLNSGKKYSIKRLPKKDATRIYIDLINR